MKGHGSLKTLSQEDTGVGVSIDMPTLYHMLYVCSQHSLPDLQHTDT